jgi:hypothetical protein
MDVSLADVMIVHGILKHIGSEARPTATAKMVGSHRPEFAKEHTYETAVVERWFMW